MLVEFWLVDAARRASPYGVLTLRRILRSFIASDFHKPIARRSETADPPRRRLRPARSDSNYVFLSDNAIFDLCTYVRAIHHELPAARTDGDGASWWRCRQLRSYVSVGDRSSYGRRQLAFLRDSSSSNLLFAADVVRRAVVSGLGQAAPARRGQVWYW